MYISKLKSTIAAVLCAAMLCTATACKNKSDSEVSKNPEASEAASEKNDGSTSDADSVEKKNDDDSAGGNYEVSDSMKNAAASYDPDGNERLYDVMKETYEGDYFIELLAGDVNMSFAIKDGTMAARTVNQGMASRAYYTEDKGFYDISDATTTYTLYENYDIRNSDSLFGATSNFKTAETDENGNFAETYAIDEDMVGTGGTIRYTFNSETGALMNYEITIANASMIYEVNNLRTTEPSDLEMPDLSDYNRQEGAN